MNIAVQKHRNKVVINLIRVLIVLVVVVTVLYHYPPARFVAAARVGRSRLCPQAAAKRTLENLRLRTEAIQRISKASGVLAKDPAGFDLWETPNGRFWAPEGENLPWLIAELGLKHVDTKQALAINDGDIVLDCGANVGVFTRAALDAGAKLVVAIEPSPRNIACLRRNFKEEIAAARVIVYEKGVWDKDDFLTLNESSTAAEDSVVIDSGNRSKGIKVPLTTIDNLVAELRLMRVDYIKMDIEGAEQKALAGARHTLTEYRPRMEISVNHLPEDPDMIPVIVKKAHPDYQMECGPCLMDGLRIRPDVVHFR